MFVPPRNIPVKTSGICVVEAEVVAVDITVLAVSSAMMDIRGRRVGRIPENTIRTIPAASEAIPRTVFAVIFDSRPMDRRADSATGRSVEEARMAAAVAALPAEMEVQTILM